MSLRKIKLCNELVLSTYYKNGDNRFLFVNKMLAVRNVEQKLPEIFTCAIHRNKIFQTRMKFSAYALPTEVLWLRRAYSQESWRRRHELVETSWDQNDKPLSSNKRLDTQMMKLFLHYQQFWLDMRSIFEKCCSVLCPIRSWSFRCFDWNPEILFHQFGFDKQVKFKASVLSTSFLYKSASHSLLILLVFWAFWISWLTEDSPISYHVTLLILFDKNSLSFGFVFLTTAWSSNNSPKTLLF